MKHTPGPWNTCNKGCPCGQIWSAHYPVAKVERGKWGDDFVSIRLVGDSSLKLKAEGFMDQITYGEIDKEVAEANARLIAAGPKGYELAERVLDCAGDCPRSVVELAKEFMAKAEGREP